MEPARSGIVQSARLGTGGLPAGTAEEDRLPLLARLTSPDRPVIREPALVIVAHPDDETLGCGGLLARLADLTIVHVTDGAPRDGHDAASHGFASPDSYAAARRRELGEALSIAGAGHARLVCLGVPDQSAALHLAEIVRRITTLVERVGFVLTHAYEGGHPDHDSTAFAVRAAAELARKRGRGLPVVEVPLYRAGPGGGWLRQGFDDRETSAAILRLTKRERAQKLAALAAYASQHETLLGFGAVDEPYRLAGRTDFGQPPNGGDVLYERYRWGMTSARLSALAEAARDELGLGP